MAINYEMKFEVGILTNINYRYAPVMLRINNPVCEIVESDGLILPSKDYCVMEFHFTEEERKQLIAALQEVE